jgi:hypothetical protein
LPKTLPQLPLRSGCGYTVSRYRRPRYKNGRANHEYFAVLIFFLGYNLNNSQNKEIVMGPVRGRTSSQGFGLPRVQPEPDSECRDHWAKSQAATPSHGRTVYRHSSSPVDLAFRPTRVTHVPCPGRSRCLRPGSGSSSSSKKNSHQPPTSDVPEPLWEHFSL